MEKSNNKVSILEAIYIVIFILAMFSGSTFLSNYVMYLLILLFILLFTFAKIQGVKKCAIKSKGDFWLKFLFILIIIYLIYQLSFTYDYNTTFAFVQRFIAYFLFLIYVPKMELSYRTLKGIRLYSFVVACSILLTTMISGSKSGGIVGSFQSAGMMMSICFGVFLIDYYYGKNNFNVIGLVLTFLALLTSGKRMFTFLAILSYLLIFWLTNDKSKRKRFIILTTIIISGIILSYFFIPSVRLVIERIYAYSGDDTFNGRSYFWTAAYDIFQKHKYFGIGMGCFSKFFGAFYYRLGNMEAYDAHNIYIQMSAELGIVGESLFIMLFLVSLLKTFKLIKNKNVRKTREKMYILSYSLYIQLWFIIYGFTGNPLYGAAQFFFYISGVAMMLSIKNQESNVQRNEDKNEIM